MIKHQLSNHIKRWNVWRKRNTNSRFHKFLTLLFGCSVSPTFAYTLTEEEAKELDDAIMKVLNK